MAIETRRTDLLCQLAIILLLALWPVALYGAEMEPKPERAAALKNGQPGEGRPAYNDCAALLAGLSNPQSALRAYEDKPAWIRYARFINRGWEQFEKRRLAVMRQWAATELQGISTPTVFYPFSGPDFINAYTLFPGAKTYLLVALEPVGEVPDFTELNEREFFASLQHSLYDLLQLDFFITKKMGAHLGNGELSGVLPILLCFLGREKARVLEVHYWLMRPDGAIEESSVAPPDAGGGGIPGVRLVFTGAGSTEKQTLFYFRANLRDDALARNQAFIAYLKGFGPLTTFAKAASYLMFKPHFSAIRQFILDRSRYVLQSDSAIPLKYFHSLAWDFRFYGTYRCPIQLFSNCHQADLAKIYKNRQEIRPLPFGIDYRHRVNTSNLMLAFKKPAVFAECGD